MPSLNRLFRFLGATALLAASLAIAQAPPKPEPKPASAQATAEHRITPEEGKELLDAVDEVLRFDSSDTGLRIKHEVKRQLADREQVQKYIEARLQDDEDTQRLRRSEVVLKKLGLLPRDFDLQTFLVALLREQVAGYYDTKTKTVYLLDWLPPASQLSVMAHELTHALQDQNFGLEKWIGKGTSEKTPTEEARGDEEIAARHAIVEGQAMAVMIDYLLAPTGNSVANSPAITQAIQQGMMESDDSPVFSRAPLFLKRVMLFPYRDGLNFERELLLKGGKDKAFADVFKSPPQNTRQVMEPATYLAGENLPQMPVPDVAKLLGKDWEKYDVGSIGEFDVSVMAEIYSGAETAARMAPQWRGGWYYAAKRKNGGALALVVVTKWANSNSAGEFAQLYRATVPKRYPQIHESGGSGTGCDDHQPCKPVTPRLTFAQTDTGRVAVVLEKDTVVAVESVPDEFVEKVLGAVLPR